MPDESYMRVVFGYNPTAASKNVYDWKFNNNESIVNFEASTVINNFMEVYMVFVNPKNNTGKGEVNYQFKRIYDEPTPLPDYSIFSKVITMGMGMSLLFSALCFFEGKNICSWCMRKMTRRKKISNGSDEEMEGSDMVIKERSETDENMNDDDDDVQSNEGYGSNQ